MGGPRMKKHIVKDEWWPVYTLEDDYGRERDIPEDLLRRYETYLRGWYEVQDELERLHNAE